jgi:hypothetical protein
MRVARVWDWLAKSLTASMTTWWPSAARVGAGSSSLATLCLSRGRPEHEDELIKPAMEGTLRVLKAAADAGVQRVVVTSSLAAVSGGHPVDNSRVYSEDDWSIIERCPPYPKSKTLAERAAWDFVASLDGEAPMELCVINPGAVLGPVLNRHYSTSGEIVRKLMAKSSGATWRPASRRPSGRGRPFPRSLPLAFAVETSDSSCANRAASPPRGPLM